MTQYQRVLLKLSGEVFGGGHVGVDPDVVSKIAHDVAEVVRSGVQVAVVTGGGNFFRGAELQQRGMDRVRADYMGMLGIVMNCLALQDFLEKLGIETRVQTAITMGQVAEPYVPRRAIRHMEKGRVVIFGAGMGILRRGHQQGPGRGRPDRLHPVRGERAADGGLRHGARGQHPARAQG